MRIFGDCGGCKHAVVAITLDRSYLIPIYDGQGKEIDSVECYGFSKRTWPHCKIGEDVFSSQPCGELVPGLPTLRIQPLVLAPVHPAV